MTGAPAPRARVEFPDLFLRQLATFIPSIELRDALLEDAVRPVMEREFETYLLPVDGIRDGAVGTEDGYLGVPALWLWFWSGEAADGVPFVVFNRAALQQALGEVEDDTS